MPTGVELATAWVRIVPSMDGVQADLTKALGGADIDGKAGEAGKKSGKSFSAGMAGIVAGVVQPIAANVLSSIQGLVSEAVEATDSTQKFQNTLKFAGVKTDVIDNLTKSTKQYADETVYSLTDVRNITAQLASNGVKDYDKLGMAAGNLNAIAGGSAETFKSVGMVLTQTAGQGKLTTENWNQLADAIPGAAGPLMDSLKKAGAYTGNFRDAMAKGQITSEEFNAALLELGSKPVAVEAAKSTTTFEGAIGNMQASIVSVISTILTKLQPAFTVITGAISTFFGFLGPVIEFIADSPPILAGLAAALAVILLPALVSATIAVWSFTAALLANPITWVILAIAALVAAIVFLATNWDAVVKWITDVWGGFVSWLTDIVNAVAEWWNGVWSAISAWFQAFWNTLVAVAKGIFQVYIGWLIDLIVWVVQNWQSIWAGIGKWFADFWNNLTTGARVVWQGFVTWITGVIVGFVGWWNSIWGGIGKVIHDVFSGIGSFIGGIWDGIVGGIRSAVNSIIRIINGVIDGINGIVGAAGAALGLNIHIPHIPMLAKGGTITASGWTIVGENGPELLNLPAGAQVNPNYDDFPVDDGGVTFNNYAPIGQSPAQALSQFANRAKGL